MQSNPFVSGTQRSHNTRNKSQQQHTRTEWDTDRDTDADTDTETDTSTATGTDTATDAFASTDTDTRTHRRTHSQTHRHTTESVTTHEERERQHDPKEEEEEEGAPPKDGREKRHDLKGANVIAKISSKPPDYLIFLVTIAMTLRGVNCGVSSQVPAVTVVPDDDEVQKVPCNVCLAVDEAVQQLLCQVTAATNTIVTSPLPLPSLDARRRARFILAFRVYIRALEVDDTEALVTT